MAQEQKNILHLFWGFVVEFIRSKKSTGIENKQQKQQLSHRRVYMECAKTLSNEKN